MLMIPTKYFSGLFYVCKLTVNVELLKADHEMTMTVTNVQHSCWTEDWLTSNKGVLDAELQMLNEGVASTP